MTDFDLLTEPWMQLVSGEPFYPLNPRVEDIHIEDIAHALGMVCRYGGHCTRFYSVAEHSWHLSLTVDPPNALWALLHDATEAYLGDMVRPLKHELPGYEAVESNLANTIARKFGLVGPMPAQIKEHDYRIVADERKVVMAPSRLPWSGDHAPLGVYIAGWNPQQATRMFLDRFKQLT